MGRTAATLWSGNRPVSDRQIVIAGETVEIAKCHRFYSKYGVAVTRCICASEDETRRLRETLAVPVACLSDAVVRDVVAREVPVLVAAEDAGCRSTFIDAFGRAGLSRRRLLLHAGLYSEGMEVLLDAITQVDAQGPNPYACALLDRYPDSGINPPRVLAEQLTREIQATLDPALRTIAVYYPDGAYRANLGSDELYERIRRKGYNVIFLFGTTLSDAYERRYGSFFVGQAYDRHGILTYLDWIDVLIIPTPMVGLPERATKVLLPHDIFDSPVGTDVAPRRGIGGRAYVAEKNDDLDYIVVPSSVITARPLMRPRAKKSLVAIPAGYPKLDGNIRRFQACDATTDSIIYAPTVTKDRYRAYVSLPEYGEQIVATLLETFPDHRIVFRPHPHTRHFRYVTDLVKRHEAEPRFVFDDNPSDYMANYARSALLVTDMSGTAFTYAFTTLRPVVFFSHREDEGIADAFDNVRYFEARTQIGYVVRTLEELRDTGRRALAERDQKEDAIRAFRDAVVYNVGTSEDYIVDSIDAIVAREVRDDWWQAASPLYSSVLEDPDAAAWTPQLVEEGYRGRNIVFYRGQYAAIAQSLGPLHLQEMDKATLDGYRRRGLVVEDASLDALKEQLNILPFSPGPDLVEEGYRGYNLVRYEDTVYALAQVLGPFDVTTADGATLEGLEASHRCFRGNSLEQVKERIDASPYRPTPELIEEDFCGYNLVRYEDCVYGLSLSLGPFDLTSASPERLTALTHEGLCVVGRLPEEVRARLLASAAKRRPSPADRPGPLARRAVRGLAEERRWKALFVSDGSLTAARAIVPQLHFDSLNLLVPASQVSAWDGMDVIPWPEECGDPPDRMNPAHLVPALQDALQARRYDVVVVPYGPGLGSLPWERLAAALAPRLMLISPGGRTRVYAGEQLARCQYNFAYLRAMFGVVPPVTGRRVLEVGCGDGLTADLVALEGAAVVVGLDMWANEGFVLRDTPTAFVQGDTLGLPVRDRSFDLCYSIATLEHVDDPFRALQEMARVLRPGGYGYVQAAPLYHSPFGHHMFGYFDDLPWVHLRRSPDEILTFCRTTGRDRDIRERTSRAAAEYISAMLSTAHVNMRRLAEYRIDEFLDRPDVEQIRFGRTTEGETLLTPEILAEIRGVSPDDLVAHGFELVFRVR